MRDLERESRREDSSMESLLNRKNKMPTLKGRTHWFDAPHCSKDSLLNKMPTKRISKCVFWVSGETERKLFHYTLPVYNPFEVEEELNRQGYKETAVIPWHLAKAYTLWSKMLWLLTRKPKCKDSLVRRATCLEKWLIVQFNKLV